MHPLIEDQIENFDLLVPFLRTRRSVIAGLELPRSKEELKRTGILNPWKFDLTSSVVATAPMAAVLGILSWIWPVPAGAPDSPRAPMEDEALKLFESVLPYTLPFILMVTAPVLAWGSLKRKDMTRDSLRRAEWDYLWLDGSLGFLPQSLIAVSGGLLSFLHLRGHQDAATISLWVPLLIGLAWQYQVLTVTIPKRLFRLNGYSDKVPKYWGFSNAKSDLGPWGKYNFASTSVGPLIAIVSMTLLAGCYLLVEIRQSLAGR